MKSQVSLYCEKIGKNPLLVQGAGGNISWKEEGTLWVKASGMALADATKHPIFLPVNLQSLQSAMSNNQFDIQVKASQESELKPSIETLIHALLPHRIVLHLHPVDVLYHLIQPHYHEVLTSLLGQRFNWVSVSYYKPGEALAAAINSTLKQSKDVSLIFLQNHGLVIGAETIEDVDTILSEVLSLLSVDVQLSNESQHDLVLSAQVSPDYRLVSDSVIAKLVFEEQLYSRLSSQWAICPDHIVFLGASAFCVDSLDYFDDVDFLDAKSPKVIFVKNRGVYISNDFSRYQFAQLRNYADVMVRLKVTDIVKVLNEYQISELLDWDAERYRLGMMK